MFRSFDSTYVEYGKAHDPSHLLNPPKTKPPRTNATTPSSPSPMHNQPTNIPESPLGGKTRRHSCSHVQCPSPSPSSPLPCPRLLAASTKEKAWGKTYLPK
ncbi:hypothetical protein K504DRAFT_193099 [Pleomassaria siparia CBS 279.74]|uniref:Uncharacterized protein n=1 Tax=Pleomassaria siparia CBS 279.74 TaxID=1314801 RepID=A0A6G1KHC9_9PLEO|nr:hypothetical protein K504DRAFT_193099 [Pleomassaria siparia CBS 279.74]